MRFLRPLCEAEATFAFMHRELAGATQVVTLLTIDGLVPQKCIEEAVHRWMRRFQILRVEIVEREGHLWFAEQDFHAAAPVGFNHGRMDDRTDSIIAAELNDILSPEGVPWRLTFNLDPTTDETNLIFTRNHAISDGYSTARLLASFLDDLQSPTEKTLTSVPLGPNIDRLTYCPKPESLPPISDASAGGVPLTSFDVQAPLRERSAGVIEVPIPADAAAGIHDLCKRHGLTFNQYFGAVLIKSYREMQDRVKTTTIFTAASIRTRFAETPMLRDPGCCIAVSSAKAPVARSVTDLAHRYGAAFAEADRRWRPQRRSHRELQAAIIDIGDRSGYPGICITNLGQLDPLLGAHARRIKRFRTAVNRKAGNYGLVLHLSSLNGEITGSLAFASPSISHARVEAIANSVASYSIAALS